MKVATIQTNLTYDQSYRLTAVDQYYNGSSTVNHVAAYLYSEAGQLVQKSLAYNTGTSTWLQNPCYRYNIRGQVVTINNSKLTADGGQTCTDTNPVFGMDLYYNTNDRSLTTAAPYYDGKLSSVKWMAMNASNARGNERAFVYSYDGVNRYTGESYYVRATAWTGNFKLTHGWDETGITYDANGNTKAMQRDSSSQAADTTGTGTLIDNLTYVYMPTMPDQLDSVKDASSSVQGFPYKATGHYSYDANGNLTADPYQGISHISYDVLNRTDTTVIVSGTKYITYTYDASGTLLRKNYYNSGTTTETDYIDGFVYVGTGTTPTLSYAPMPEGRLLTTSLTQEYVITDPQGNARVSFQNNSGVAKVTQENSYYGYGLQMPGSLVGFSSPPNKHMYNGGSEWQNDTKSVNAGVPDYYQTFYRNYDPTLGRFIGVDPMAVGNPSLGVYHYAGDNPVMGNDPEGDKQRPCGSCSCPPSIANIDPGLGDSGGGGGGIYTDPADAIGRNADPNWMNDGQFDDVGSGIDPKTGKSYGSEGGLSFSSDEGAAGRAFWLPAEMSGGSLDNISPGLRNQIMGGLASLGAAIGGAYSQNLVTTLRSGQLIFGGQTSFVKNGEFYVRGLPNVWVFDDDDQGGQQTSPFSHGQRVDQAQDIHGVPMVSSQIAVGFNAAGTNYHYDRYAWIQTVSHNGGSMRVDMVPGSHNFPFYDEFSAFGPTPNYTSVFGDQPANYGPTFSFNAELTLVGFIGTKITAIATWTWGFNIQNNAPGAPVPFNLIPAPSPNMQSTIQQYNNTH